jgi:hypothetical protein
MHTWHLCLAAFPNALSESLLASLMSKVKPPKAQQPTRPHPHRRPRLQWKAHSTGNKAAGFRPRLFTFLRYCLSQLPGGNRTVRELSTAAAVSQGGWTFGRRSDSSPSGGAARAWWFLSTAPLLPWEGHNPYEDWWTCLYRTWFHITLQDSRGCIKQLLPAPFLGFRPCKCLGHWIW